MFYQASFSPICSVLLAATIVGSVFYQRIETYQPHGFNHVVNAAQPAATHSPSNLKGESLKQMESMLQNEYQALNGGDLSRQEISAMIAEKTHHLRQRQAQRQQQSHDMVLSTPWQVVEVCDETLKNSFQKDIKVKQHVAISASLVRVVSIGDHIAMDLPTGNRYVSIVEDVQSFTNGDKGWFGYIESEGQRYPVSFTAGSDSVYATIASPEGSYTLETSGGRGWLYLNPEIAELVDPNQPDQLIPSQSVTQID